MPETHAHSRSRSRSPHTHGRTDCCIVGCDNPCLHGVCQYHRTLFRLWRGQERTPAHHLAFLRARCRMVGHPDPCWDPDAKSINEKGYVWVTLFSRRKMRGHRLCYRLQNMVDGGEWHDLKPTDYILHSEVCEERFIKGLIQNRCWNPAHLRIGSEEENTAERKEHRIKYDPFAVMQCIREGCERKAASHGYCRKHLAQWKRDRRRDEVQDLRL